MRGLEKEHDVGHCRTFRDTSLVYLVTAVIHVYLNIFCGNILAIMFIFWLRPILRVAVTV